MKYKATIIYPMYRISEVFPTVSKAEQWLDSQNNNIEYTTTIAELNDNGEIVDWFYYTEAKR